MNPQANILVKASIEYIAVNMYLNIKNKGKWSKIQRLKYNYILNINWMRLESHHYTISQNC